MSSDIEELAREGMQQFTAAMQVSPDLAARTCDRHRHRRRLRRKRTGLAAGAAAVAGVALAVTALVPGSHQPSHRAGHQGGVQMAAWTVAEQTGGSVMVTIRELHDPAGLQRKLRADGVPATVTFISQQNPSCRPYSAGQALVDRVFPHQGPPSGSGVVMIHSSALPAGTGILLDASFSQHPPPGGSEIAIGVGLVQASQQCTG